MLGRRSSHRCRRCPTRPSCCRDASTEEGGSASARRQAARASAGLTPRHRERRGRSRCARSLPANARRPLRGHRRAQTARRGTPRARRAPPRRAASRWPTRRAPNAVRRRSSHRALAGAPAASGRTLLPSKVRSNAWRLKATTIARMSARALSRSRAWSARLKMRKSHLCGAPLSFRGAPPSFRSGESALCPSESIASREAPWPRIRWSAYAAAWRTAFGPPAATMTSSVPGSCRRRISSTYEASSVGLAGARPTECTALSPGPMPMNDLPGPS